jgi:hypothetical protein
MDAHAKAARFVVPASQVRRDPPRLVLAEQLARRAPTAKRVGGTIPAILRPAARALLAGRV